MESLRPYFVQWLSNEEVPLANKFYREHGFRGKARRHERCAVVRNERRAIIACGYVRDHNEFTLLAGVAVAPDYQCRGIARLLLQQLSEAFDSRTYTFPYSQLLPFYASIGFRLMDAEGSPLAVGKLFQGYRDQGREIDMMVFG